MERFLICKNRICGLLDIPLSCVNVESYICSDPCFRSLKRFEKLQEDAKPLDRTITQWNMVFLRTRQFPQVLQHQQHVFASEKIKEGSSPQKVCHIEKSGLNQIPKM